MSAFKEFNELHPTIKTVCIGLALLMPFWYLDIYLFSKIPIDKNIQIPIVISFCLSVCWFSLNAITYIAFISTKIIGNNQREIEKPNSEEQQREVKKVTDETFELISFFSVMYLAIATLIGYLIKLKFHTLIYICFASAFLRLVAYLTTIFVQGYRYNRM